MIKKLSFFLIAITIYSCGIFRNRSTSQRTQADTLTICSFNIMWLGSYTKKDNEALATLLEKYDIVVVQELVAPPFDGIYPDGTTFTGDPQSCEFFNAMGAAGFSYVLSEEDTGPNEVIHDLSSNTEWWVCFYKADRVGTANDLPTGFLASDRSANPDFKRVPYAFGFRKNKLDFVLISVHLAPGNRDQDMEFRAGEFQAIYTWIDANNASEKDFIILGDMNIENFEELSNVTPAGYISLNDECRKTNTASESNKPYDHVIYSVSNSAHEIDLEFDLVVIDLVEAMRTTWKADQPYPGDPYNHNLFKQYFSDHHPIVFKMIVPARDDDGF